MSQPPFEEIVAAHGPAVLRVCRAWLAEPDAADAWSETFLAALRAYPALRPESNVRGWLVTIARRKALDVLRSRARHAPRAAEPLEELAERSAPERAPADDELRRALDRLPPKQRGALVYRWLAELPYAEVGARLGCSAAAARRSAADGLASLREHYARSARAQRSPRAQRSGAAQRSDPAQRSGRVRERAPRSIPAKGTSPAKETKR